MFNKIRKIMWAFASTAVFLIYVATNSRNGSGFVEDEDNGMHGKDKGRTKNILLYTSYFE